MSARHDRAGRSRRRSAAEIRAEIEDTRSRLAADIDDARVKFSRRGLEHQAMSALRGVRHEATGAIDGLTHTTEGQAGQMSRIAVDAVKRFPAVTTLLGLGLAFLAFSSARRRSMSQSHDIAPREERYVAAPAAHADLPPTNR